MAYSPLWCRCNSDNTSIKIVLRLQNFVDRCAEIRLLFRKWTIEIILPCHAGLEDPAPHHDAGGIQATGREKTVFSGYGTEMSESEH